MTLSRSELLRQRLRPFGIELSRLLGGSNGYSYWMVEKGDAILGCSWHILARNLNRVEDLILRLEDHAAGANSGKKGKQA